MKNIVDKCVNILSFLIIAFLTSAYAEPASFYVIDAHKNAVNHNNLGLMYLEERGYYAAIEEFKIAISLAPNTQASSVYYKNLGDTYMIVGSPELAQDCYLNAINLYSLNFQFYKDLAKCYKAMGIAQSKIAEYKNDKNPLNSIMRGLLQEQTGDIKGAITTLDTFATSEPDLLITPSVKVYIKTLVKKIN